MADEVKTEEPRIEPYYQGQGKYLVDTLFDLGCLSESLSRDGLVKVEDLAALMFQQIADSANRCAGFTKKYKKDGHDEGERVRHEEEKRWIERAKGAEHEVLKQRSEILALQEENEKMHRMAQAEEGALRDPFKVARWVADTGDFLENLLGPFFPGNMAVFRANARGLLDRGMNEGILPDCRPGKEWKVAPEQDLSQEEFRPGSIHRVSNVGEPEPVPGPEQNPGVCPQCGKHFQCESMHGFNRCQLPQGHPGCHEYRDGRHIEQWG